MSLIEAVILATSLILGTLLVAAIFTFVTVSSYKIGKRYGHEDLGFILGILLDVWLVLVILFY